MGKLTISIYGHGFNNFLYVYQEGKPPFSYGFPMVFLWFSYGSWHNQRVSYALLPPGRLVFFSYGHGTGISSRCSRSSSPAGNFPVQQMVYDKKTWYDMVD